MPHLLLSRMSSNRIEAMLIKMRSESQDKIVVFSEEKIEGSKVAKDPEAQPSKNRENGSMIELALTADARSSERKNLNLMARPGHRRACRSWCRCSCHKRSTLSLPRALEPILGWMAVRYTGLPLKCSETTCQQRTNFRSQITYFFPHVFLPKAAIACASLNQFGNPSFGVVIRNLVAPNAWSFSSARIGRITVLQNLFSARDASPFDLHRLTGETALAVRYQRMV
jgi:hypothetical protein